MTLIHDNVIALSFFLTLRDALKRMCILIIEMIAIEFVLGNVSAFSVRGNIRIEFSFCATCSCSREDPCHSRLGRANMPFKIPHFVETNLSLKKCKYTFHVYYFFGFHVPVSCNRSNNVLQ